MRQALLVALLLGLSACGTSPAETERRPALRPDPPAVEIQLPAARRLAEPMPDDLTPALADSAQASADAFEADGSAASWYEAGRYYLTAAFQNRESDPARSAQWARRAVADFDKSIEIEPDPDVRLALVEATALDPGNSARSAQELQSLLADVPDHPGGNFLRGERLLMIGRVDRAEAHFRRAIAASNPDDRVARLAEHALAAIEAERGRTP